VTYGGGGPKPAEIDATSQVVASQDNDRFCSDRLAGLSKWYILRTPPACAKATVRDAIDKELGAQIASVREQFDAARAEHPKGQQSVNAKLAELAAQRHQLDEIEGALDDMLERISSVEQEAAAAAN